MRALGFQHVKVASAPAFSLTLTIQRVHILNRDEGLVRASARVIDFVVIIFLPQEGFAVRSCSVPNRHIATLAKNRRFEQFCRLKATWVGMG